MNPNYWGKYFWNVIHITALDYPNNPSKNDEKIYAQFYKSIGQVLPCSKCRKNYERHFENIPIHYFLENRKSLFKWTVHLHNIVNKELGKPQWSVEYAESFYKSREKNDVVNKEEAFQMSKTDGNQHSMNGENCIIQKTMILVNIIAILFFLFIYWYKL